MQRKPKHEDLQAPSKAAPRTRTVVRRYHVALTPKEALERLAELPGVKAYDRRTLPDFGGSIEHSDYTLEYEGEQFLLHCGSPAARGQSATGMVRILYLRGQLTRTEEGTLVELSFAHRRPRWALHRWLGFIALASLGLLWVLIGPGELGKKALLYGLLLLVLGPVVVHDLRGGEPLEERRKALLNLLEHSFGPIQIDQPHPDEPYRRRMLASVEAPRADRHDDDDDDD